MNLPFDLTFDAATGTGILMALTSAVLQTCSYFLSRWFLHRNHADTRLLFGLCHVQMSLMALLALPLLLHGPLPPPGPWIGWLISYTAFYLAGQFLLFVALQKADSSLVVPLLGLKIPILALFSVFFQGQSPPPIGWLAVVLATAAALMLAPPGRRVNLQVLLLTAGVCLFYSGADLSIPGAVRGLSGASRLPNVLAVCLTSVLVLPPGAIVLWRRRSVATRQAHLDAIPYSASWLFAMMFFFTAITSLGVVLCNIIQSSRSLMAVFAGAILAHRGWTHIDSLRSRRMFAQRLAGAVLMLVAIVLYVGSRR